MFRCSYRKVDPKDSKQIKFWYQGYDINLKDSLYLNLQKGSVDSLVSLQEKSHQVNS